MPTTDCRNSVYCLPKLRKSQSTKLTEEKISSNTEVPVFLKFVLTFSETEEEILYMLISATVPQLILGS